MGDKYKRKNFIAETWVDLCMLTSADVQIFAHLPLLSFRLMSNDHFPASHSFLVYF